METYTLLKRALALFLVVFIIIGYLIVPLLPGGNDASNGSISPFSSSGDIGKNYQDCTKFWNMLKDDGQNEYELYTLVGSPTILRNIEQPDKTLYVILGVQKDFRPADIEVLKEFYKNGGKLIIADDFGYGNTFAEQFNVHFFGHGLWDAVYSRNVSFPLVYAHLDFAQYLLMLDKPSGIYLRPGDPNIEVLANGSKDSYIDMNENGLVDGHDIPGPIPVISMYREPGASGAIIFVSDPDMFNDDKIYNDGLMDRKGNDKTPANNSLFIRDLVRRLLPTGGKVVFDESRHVPEKALRPFYDTLGTVTIVTSNPRELVFMMFGLMLIIIMTIVKAKDKEAWFHQFDIGKITRRSDLPESRREMRDRLRAIALRKLRIENGLAPEELQAMTPTQLASLIKDHDINELVLNDERDMTDEELRQLVKKLRSS